MKGIIVQTGDLGVAAWTQRLRLWEALSTDLGPTPEILGTRGAGTYATLCRVLARHGQQLQKGGEA